MLSHMGVLSVRKLIFHSTFISDSSRLLARARLGTNSLVHTLLRRHVTRETHLKTAKLLDRLPYSPNYLLAVQSRRFFVFYTKYRAFCSVFQSFYYVPRENLANMMFFHYLLYFFVLCSFPLYFARITKLFKVVLVKQQ